MANALIKPKISVLLVSHDKPAYCRTAMTSVQAQTFGDWNMILVDSGKLVDSDYFAEDFVMDPRIWIEKSDEPENLASKCNPHSWVANRVLNSGRLNGELILFLCDDDLYYPWAFQALWDFYKGAPERNAMYGHIHLGKANAAGVTDFIGRRHANMARGRACAGPGLDCQVDYLQFAFSQKALAQYRHKFGIEILSEKLEDKGHADGIFMERMGELMPVYAVPAWLGMNRRTPASRFAGTG